MQNQKIVFSQITSLIPWYKFDQVVKEFNGDYRYKKFKSRDHLLVMIFAQLTYREGLRAIESSLNSQRAKLYHMGLRCEQIARNTIAKANEVRDYRIYEKLTNILATRAKELYVNDKILDDLEFDQSIYALDSSVINICFSLAPWEKYSEKQGIGAFKLHSLIDLKGNISIFNVITDGKVYDGAILDILPFEAGSIYIMDRGYLDYKRLYKKRWQIELFFKWIKQHLKIKTFYSYNENGVKVQIWTAICTYLLVAILKKELKINHSLYTILQVLSVNIFERTQVNQLFAEFDYKSYEEDYHQALLL